MHSAQPATEPIWQSLSGRVLEGGYELGELLSAEPDGASFRVRVLGDRNLEALAHFRRGDASVLAQQAAIWDSARRLQRPNFDAPLSSGQTQLDTTQLIYVVTRKPDEVLEDILKSRALASDEAGEVLVSASRALELLLKNGMVHGCVCPGQIVAVSNSIQLTGACVRSVGAAPPFEFTPPRYVAPESEGQNLTPAADIWCLGASMYEALTQRPFDPGDRNASAALPPPFDEIVKRCVEPDPQNRADVAQVLALHGGEQPPAPARHSQAAPAQRSTGRRRAEEEKLPSKIWIYAAVALLIVIIVAWAAFTHTGKTSRAAGPIAPAPKMAAPATGSWVTKTLPADSADAKPSVTPPPTISSPKMPASPRIPPATDSAAANVNANIKGPVWRVVLFTYNREPDAEKKADAVNAKDPSLKAQVFTPNSSGGPYLVTIGGPSSRESAAQLRRKALRSGMPRDCYIQNYNR